MARSYATVAAVALAVLSALVIATSAFSTCQEAPILVGIGSSTVFPIADLYARKYSDEHIISVARSTGSTLGLRNLLLGAADIAHASRAMQAKDYTNADCDGSLVGSDGQASSACQGVMPMGVNIADDAIAIVVNAGSDLANVALADIPALFSEGSDYNLYIPDKLSGTYDFFTETAGFEPSGVTEFFADDGLVVDAVANDPQGLGFLGIGHVASATGIKVVSVGGVDPTDQDAVDGYTFFRPLYMYYDTNSDKKAMVERYLCGMLTEAGQRGVAAADYMPLPEADVAAQRDALSCDSLPESTAETFDGGDTQFIFCKDLRSILTLGSSTVYPAANMASEAYPNPFVRALARSAGSSVGLQTYLAGGSDVAAASRRLAPKDYAAFGCDEAGVSDNGVAIGSCQGKVPVGLIIGRDMLSIVVPEGSATNGGFDMDALRAAVADPFTTLCVPDVQSGTRDFFEEEVAAVPEGVAGFTNDNDILDCVRNGGENALGVVPVAYLTGDDADLSGLRVLSIDGASPIDNPDTYPLARPLFLYFDSTPASVHDQTQNFICSMMTAAGQQVVADVGYSPVADTAQELEKVGLVCPQQFLR